MKKLVQNTGVRKWYGDEWITIQDEVNAVLEGLFGHYSTPFILNGCEVNGTTIASGIVGLIHSDGFKLCRFYGATDVTFPIYLKPVKTEQTGLYLDGATKAISYIYAAEVSATTDTGYLEIKSDGTTLRFNDIIQDAGHRMVSDTEKTSYAGQAASAVNIIRGGVDAAYNTLKKLKDAIPDSANLNALKIELRGDVDEALNTMEKIVDYIDNLTYLPTFAGTSALTGSVIDWRGTPELTKILLEPTEVDASNLIAGKTIGMKVSGAFALTFTAKFVKMSGSRDYSLTRVNYIQMRCINAGSGTEEIIYSIAYYDE
jgi:hypothetical protein